MDYLNDAYSEEEKMFPGWVKARLWCGQTAFVFVNEAPMPDEKTLDNLNEIGFRKINIS